MNLTVYLKRILSTFSHTFEWHHRFFRRPLAVIQYSQRYCVSFKQALAVTPLFIGIQLPHNSSCSHLFDELPFFYYKRVIVATHIYCKQVCYMTTSFTAIHFFCDSDIISREQSTCQGNCLYFTILFATIHYRKRKIEKVEEYVYLWKTIVALLF